MRTLLALLRGVNVGKGKPWASCRSSLDGAEWCYSAGAHLTARNGKHIDNNAESLLGRTENTYVPSWVGSVLADRSPFWRICKRVGYSPWLSLLILVPLANLAFIYYLAFADWPSEKKTTAA
jgi:hypothetical protein